MKRTAALSLALGIISLFGKTDQAEALLFPNELSEWQLRDYNGLIFPWFTHPFLDILKTWNMCSWDVFEWGSGYSTIWFASRCKKIVSIEHNPEWIKVLRDQLWELGFRNARIKRRTPKWPFHIGSGGETSDYVLAIHEEDTLYDCIIIDGEYHRNTCAVHALKRIKKNGVIILDNANQASIGLNSQPTFDLLEQYEHHSFRQPNHPDWRTDYWIIN